MGWNAGYLLCTIGMLVIVSMVRCQSNRGTPGVDYPNYFSIPETSFSCSKQKYIPGFYADMETQCQAFHFCYQNRQESFLCPTGTIFNQEILACDPWYNFNCSLAPSFFSKNAGPAMAKAGKNIPMLLKLRSTQGRSKVQTPKKVYDKVETPYETGIKNEESLKDSVESESLNKVSSKEEPLVNSQMKGSEPDVLADIEANQEEVKQVKDVAEESPDYSAEDENVELEDTPEDIVYDPVTDGYYMKYDKYEPGWQPESEPVSDEFSNFYNYESQPQENEEMEKESTDEYGDEENEILSQSSDNLDLNKVIDGGIDETTDFSKRLMESDLQPKRTRRKPLYVVVPDEDDEMDMKLSGRPRRTSSSNERDGSASDVMEQSSEANDTSENSEQDQSGPFPRPTAIPSHLLNHTTERPLTSEEFNAAIMSELVEPQLTDDDLGPLIGSTHMQQDSTQTQTGDASRAQQTDMQNEQPSDDSYNFEYSGQRGDALKYTNLHSDPPYQGTAETSEESDEIFVVIPDELDMPSVVETDPMASDEQTTPISQMYGDDYSQYRSSFESPEAYGSYQFRPPPPPVHGFGNYPEGWRRDYQHYLSNVRDRYYQNQHGFQMNQPIGYEHPYRRPDSPYFYDDVYPGSHPQESGGPSYASDYTNYADPASAVWIPGSSEDVELSVDVVSTQSPTLDITEASVIDVESSSVADLGLEPDDAESDLSGEVSQDDEKYYVFDFDEEELEAEKDDSEMLKDLDSMKPEAVESDSNESPDLKESYETDQLESLEAVDSNITQDVESNNSGSREEISSDSEYPTSEHEKIEPPSELDINEDKTFVDTQPLTTESSRTTEEPVTLSSAFERLAALKKKPQPPSLQSYDFSKDPSFMNNVEFPESMDFGPYGYGSTMDQQYGMLDSTNTKTGNKFLHRTGESEQSKLSKLSAIQDRIRSVKQGKFGMFKKYIGSTRNL